MNQKEVTHIFDTDENGDEWVKTNGTSILGADDKAGVTVCMYMMEKKIPGIYYFFVGEEVGLVGSGRLANNYERFDFLKDIKRIVSFDRRGFNSIISRQMGRQCCSSDFVSALGKQYSEYGMVMTDDPTGIYTDSAIFMDKIPECTNISVGYFNEHTHRECQNLSFLERLCEATIQIDWESLPTSRSLSIDDEIYEEKADIIEHIESLEFVNDKAIYEEEGKLMIALTVDDTSSEVLLTEIEALHESFNKYKSDIDVQVKQNTIEIIVN
jgi:di/tripeptidase